MIKVLHIISGDLWAGKEVMAFNLIRNLHGNKNIKVQACVFNKGQLYKYLKECEIGVCCFNENTINPLSLVIKLNKLLHKFHPNIIHCHGYKENIIAGLAALGCRKLHSITTIHGLPEKYTGKKAFRYFLFSWLNTMTVRYLFKSVVCVSNDIFNILTKSFSNLQLSVIHNGINICKNTKINRKHSFFTVGSAGRLCSIKNFPLMIKVCSLLSNNIDILFTLAGDGPALANLKEMVKRNGIEDIFYFTGSISDMGQFYDSIDLYINTSLHEGIPMTILEAMARGLPIIAPHTGGIPEIVRDKIDGLTIMNWEPVLFAEAVLKLKNDLRFYNKCSVNARSRVTSSFSLEQCTNHYLNLYNKSI